MENIGLGKSGIILYYGKYSSSEVGHYGKY